MNDSFKADRLLDLINGVDKLDTSPTSSISLSFSLGHSVTHNKSQRSS